MHNFIAILLIVYDKSTVDNQSWFLVCLSIDILPKWPPSINGPPSLPYMDHLGWSQIFLLLFITNQDLCKWTTSLNGPPSLNGPLCPGPMVTFDLSKWTTQQKSPIFFVLLFLTCDNWPLFTHHFQWWTAEECRSFILLWISDNSFSLEFTLYKMYG